MISINRLTANIKGSIDNSSGKDIEESFNHVANLVEELHNVTLLALEQEIQSNSNNFANYVLKNSNINIEQSAPTISLKETDEVDSRYTLYKNKDKAYYLSTNVDNTATGFHYFGGRSETEDTSVFIRSGNVNQEVLHTGNVDLIPIIGTRSTGNYHLDGTVGFTIDDFRQTGFIESHPTGTNAGTVPDGGTDSWLWGLQVENGNLDDYGFQFFFINNTGKYVLRHKRNNVLSDWEYLYTTENRPTALEIGAISRTAFNDLTATFIVNTNSDYILSDGTLSGSAYFFYRDKSANKLRIGIEGDVNVTFMSSLYVEQHNAYNIGEDGKRFKNLYLEGDAFIRKSLKVPEIYANGSELRLFAGEARNHILTGQTSEYVYSNSELGFIVTTPDPAHSNFQTGFTLNQTIISGHGITISGNSVYHQGNIANDVVMINSDSTIHKRLIFSGNYVDSIVLRPLDASTSSYAGITWRNENNISQWLLIQTNNTDRDLHLQGRSDIGAYQHTSFRIKRDTGIVEVPQGLVVGDTAKLILNDLYPASYLSANASNTYFKSVNTLNLDAPVGINLRVGATPNTQVNIFDNGISFPEGKVLRFGSTDISYTANNLLLFNSLGKLDIKSKELQTYIIDNNKVIELKSSEIIAHRLLKSYNNIIAGEGSGGVALTVNDGYGNANLTFNHAYGVPDANGNSFRVTANTDSNTDPIFTFQVAENVTAGQTVAPVNVLNIGLNTFLYKSYKIVHGGGDTWGGNHSWSGYHNFLTGLSIENGNNQLKIVDTTYSNKYWAVSHQSGHLYFTFNSNNDTGDYAFKVTEQGNIQTQGSLTANYAFINGVIVANSDGTGNVRVKSLNADNYCGYEWRDENDVARWLLYKMNNAKGNLALQGRRADGVYQWTAWSVDNDTGVTDFKINPTFSGSKLLSEGTNQWNGEFTWLGKHKFNQAVEVAHTNNQLKLIDTTYNNYYWMLSHQNGDLHFVYNSLSDSSEFALKIQEEGHLIIGSGATTSHQLKADDSTGSNFRIADVSLNDVRLGDTTKGLLLHGNGDGNLGYWNGTTRHKVYHQGFTPPAKEISGWATAEKLMIVDYQVPVGTLENNTTLPSGHYTSSTGLRNYDDTEEYAPTWWHVLNLHHSGNNGYNAQIGVKLASSHDADLVFRRSSNGAWTQWYKVFSEQYFPTQERLNIIKSANFTDNSNTLQQGISVSDTHLGNFPNTLGNTNYSALLTVKADTASSTNRGFQLWADSQTDGTFRGRVGHSQNTNTDGGGIGWSDSFTLFSDKYLPKFKNDEKFLLGDTGQLEIYSTSSASYLAGTQLNSTLHFLTKNQMGMVNFTMSIHGGSSHDYVILKSGGYDIATTNPDALLINRALQIKNSNSQVSQHTNQGDIAITTQHGYVTLGPINTTTCNITTDVTNFYFNKPIYAVEGLTVHGTLTHIKQHNSRFEVMGNSAISTTLGTANGFQLYQNTNADGSDAYQSFHIGGRYAIHFGLSAERRRLVTGGWSDGAFVKDIITSKPIHINGGTDTLTIKYKEHGNKALFMLWGSGTRTIQIDNNNWQNGDTITIVSGNPTGTVSIKSLTGTLYKLDGTSSGINTPFDYTNAFEITLYRSSSTGDWIIAE